MDTPIRSVNNGKFRVPATPHLKRIGYGTGVGVFQVDRSPKNGLMSSPWAIKKIMRTQGYSGIEKRLYNEAELLKKLNHPNIVGFRAFTFTDDGRACLAVERCEISLGDLIENQQEIGSFSVVQIEKVALHVARALDYLHNIIHILHGDVKSHNILIKGDFEEIKLCDFGVSLPLKLDGSFDKDSAPEGTSYVGTRLWSAPEVQEKDDNELIITEKADIFSYGLTLWEMLTLSTAPHMGFLDEQCFDSSNDSDSFNESALEEVLAELIGTRPSVPEEIFREEGNRTIIELFTKCTEADYKVRFSTTDVLNFLNNIHTLSS